MAEITALGQIEVTRRTRVRTKNSVYLISPVDMIGTPGYEVVKIENLLNGCTRIPVGWHKKGVDLRLQIGSYLQLGSFCSSEVLAVETVDGES